ncbi:CGNR zinc finger domain-containing protein [Streptomyces sp. NBC_01497]|uniref:CGNR zinc finger domain-containing protein n=1 Tax=Streptomyces sp. NBC_01497 TaxID=2903885 RepID=UPI002E2ED561|nr:CGNR zinc finger domain-containing protein [Streptomyces sp. NBC_01497]
MSWMATGRYRLRQAPGGLALVQDLVNTKGIQAYRPDLLATPESASAWLADAVQAWAGERDTNAPEDVSHITADDLPRLRELRAAVDALLPAGTGARQPVEDIPSTRIRLTPGPEGRVAVVPVGSGAAWAASAVWSEILLAQLDGAWSRLKLCRNEDCASAFYDTSRNNSGVWHDVRTCGNAANLRASRARRRRREASATGDI